MGNNANTSRAQHTQPSLGRPTGVVLAGGLSRRMGGGDKGLLDLAGRSMISRVISRLQPQVGCMLLNANGDPARFAALGLPVAADALAGFVGPLAGVLAGMRWSAANASAASTVVTVSSDVPFLPDDLVVRLAAAAASRPGAIAIASSGEELHPVIGLWPVALADDLEGALNKGVRKVLEWTDRHGTVPVEFPFLQIGARTVDPFYNANTPEELAEARRLIEAAEAP